MIACRRGNLEIANLLCESGASLNLQSIDGLTALHWASGENHLACTRLLCAFKGAALDLQTHDGLIALMIACLEGHLEITTLLCEKGASLNIQWPDGATKRYPWLVK